MALQIPPRANEYYGLNPGTGRKLRESLISYDRGQNQGIQNPPAKVENRPALSNTEAKKPERTDSVRRTSNALRISAERLSKDPSLFEPETVRRENPDGKTVFSESYDTDRIYHAVREFTKDYNAALKSAEASPLKGVNEKASEMSYLTHKNADALGRAGIAVAKDGTLSVDEDRFRNADMEKAGALFTGAGSFGDTIAARAGMIDSQAAIEDAKARIYNADGSASYFASGNMFDLRF